MLCAPLTNHTWKSIPLCSHIYLYLCFSHDSFFLIFLPIHLFFCFLLYLYSFCHLCWKQLYEMGGYQDEKLVIHLIWPAQSELHSTVFTPKRQKMQIHSASSSSSLRISVELSLFQLWKAGNAHSLTSMNKLLLNTLHALVSNFHSDIWTLNLVWLKPAAMKWTLLCACL